MDPLMTDNSEIEEDEQKWHRWISQSCQGETCNMCGAPAAAKVGEEIFEDDPFQMRHNLTAYVCADHFRQIMGPAAERIFCRKF